MTGGQCPLHAISPTSAATNSLCPFARITMTEKAEVRKRGVGAYKQQGDIEVEGKKRKNGNGERCDGLKRMGRVV